MIKHQDVQEILLSFDFGDNCDVSASSPQLLNKHLKDLFLLGCYRTDVKDQLPWILSPENQQNAGRYNIRIEKGRDGWVNAGNPRVLHPDYVILYEYGTPTNYRTFKVDGVTVVSQDEMAAMNYPDPLGSYLLYNLTQEVTFEAINVEAVISKQEENASWVSGKPIFLSGSALIDAQHNKVKKLQKNKDIMSKIFNETEENLPSRDEVLESLTPTECTDGQYTSIDLFSGCGGLTKGFSMAGIKSIFASDIDENAAKTFMRNFPSTPFLCKSITDTTKEEVDKLLDGHVPDIIVGGPPCQGFSLANKRRNKVADDPRNKLFYGFVKFINWYSPKAFVMENVKGLLSMQNGEVIKTIVEEFSKAGECGYDVEYKVLRASDYGVPQNRERVILIGFRKDLHLKPTHPLPYQLDHLVTVDEAISDLPQIASGQGSEVMAYPVEPSNDYQRMMRADSRYVLNHVAMKHTPRLVERFKAIKAGQSLIDVWETHGAVKRGAPGEKSTIKFSQNNQRLFGDQPAPTIAASFQSNFIHPHLDRNFTAREGARLQSFPDDFVFEGMRTKMSWEKGLSQYQQIGNAVPVLLAKAIAEAVVEQLNKL